MVQETLSARLVEVESMLDRSRRRFEEGTRLVDEAQIGIRSTAWDPDTRVVDKGPVTLSILAVPESDSQVASAQIHR